MMAGLEWGLFLAVWFVFASLVSRARHGVKHVRTRSVIGRSGPRDAWQVLANGGVFFTLAGLRALNVETGADPAILAASALIAAGADTAATEVGTMWRGSPVSLRTMRRVPPGTSGAVSLPGTVAMLAAAILLSHLAISCRLIPSTARGVVIIAALSGCVADTLIGAFLQARRSCLKCGADTESSVHECGGATGHVGGLSWMMNDSVNVCCTLVGAAISFLLLWPSG